MVLVVSVATYTTIKKINWLIEREKLSVSLENSECIASSGLKMEGCRNVKWYYGTLNTSLEG